MIIDPIINQTPKRTGIGEILLLSVITISLPMAAFMINNRINSVDFSRVQRPEIGGRRDIHFATFASILIFLYAFLLLAIGFCSGESGIFFKILFFILFLCGIKTAVSLYIYGNRYGKRVVDKSDALIMHAKKTGFIDTTKPIKDGTVTLTVIDIGKFMSAFKRYGIIEFYEEKTGLYSVKKFHPLVERYFEKCSMAEPPELPDERMWTCQGCGAENSSSECQYCGRKKS